MTQVIKRDCTEELFNKSKIYNAVIKAMKNGNGLKTKIAENIANEIEEEVNDLEEKTGRAHV